MNTRYVVDNELLEINEKLQNLTFYDICTIISLISQFTGKCNSISL